MHDFIILGSRLLVKALEWLVASLAFYMALFLYKSEKGRLENRIDTLWIWIDDRAKRTRRLSTALMNRVGASLTTFYDRLFGPRLLSLHMLSVSVNLSMAFTAFFTAFWRDMLSSIIVVTLPNGLSELTATIIAGFVFTFAALPAILVPRRAIFLSSLTLFVVITGWTYYGAIAYEISPMRRAHGYPLIAILGTVPLLLLPVGVVCDALALIAIRKLLRYIAVEVLLTRIISHALDIGLILCWVFVVPLCLSPLIDGGFSIVMERTVPHGHVGYIMLNLALLNASTAVYCLIPLLFLLLLLSHRIVWPILSRILYPVADNKLITNRAFLLSIASLAFALALGITPATLKGMAMHFLH
jgi:hypothetical protein